MQSLDRRRTLGKLIFFLFLAAALLIFWWLLIYLGRSRRGQRTIRKFAGAPDTRMRTGPSLPPLGSPAHPAATPRVRL